MAASIPKTQRAAVVEKPGKEAKAIVKEVPVEEPKDGEVLIKMEATGGTYIYLRNTLIL
jgi:NADPH:quinone reductase-like Zn-dependent oxidoreductase